jgi:hypothetical protein
LAVAAAALTALWFMGAGLIRQNIEGWAAEWRAGGNALSYRSLEITGFPVLFHARMTDPVIGGADGAAPWEWRAPALQARLAPWQTRRIDGIELAGRHLVSFISKGAPVRLTIDAARAEGSLEFAPEAITAIGDAAGLKALNEANGERIEIVTAAVRADLSRRPDPDHLTPVIALGLDLGGVVLPPRLTGARISKAEKAGPLGPKIEALAFKGAVMGPISPAYDTEAFAAWRDSGGTVEIENFRIHWGPLRLSANGTLALDAKMQPMGALKTTIAGFAETLDALVAARAMKEKNARTAKFVLAMLAKSPAPDAPPELSLPLTVQKRTLSVGPVAIANMPPLRWPRR